MLFLGLVIFVSGYFIFSESIQEVFGYRYRLFVVSMDVIKSNFLFGNLSALDDPRMDVLIQGEGIVDIVNSYIWLALFYGMLAVVLFLGAVFFGLTTLYNERRRSDENYALGAFSFCSLLVMIFNLATTSPIGWAYQWVWICLPICCSLVAASKRRSDE